MPSDRMIRAQEVAHVAYHDHAETCKCRTVGHLTSCIAFRVLSDLGIAGENDDAAYRLAGYMSTTEPYQHLHPENLLGHAKRCLEAALTPTNESRSSDA